MTEQRNAYKGSPPRPWLRIAVVAADGTTGDLNVVADTGNPCALIVGSSIMQRFNQGIVPGIATNFGHLAGCWLRIQIPDVSYDEVVLAYSSDDVTQAVESSHPDLAGLAGLPLLRKMEYGGNGNDFWIRKA